MYFSDGHFKLLHMKICCKIKKLQILGGLPPPCPLGGVRGVYSGGTQCLHLLNDSVSPFGHFKILNMILALFVNLFWWSVHSYVTILHFRDNGHPEMRPFWVLQLEYWSKMKNIIRNEFCTNELVILHVSHTFLWQKWLSPIFQDGRRRHLELQKNGGLTQKRPVTFGIGHI